MSALSHRTSTRATVDLQMTRRLEEAAGWAVLAFLMAVPATAVWVPASGHDYSRFLEIGVCLLCASALAMRRPALPGRVTTALWAVALVLAVLATAHAPEQFWAWRELALALGLSGVAVLVARHLRYETLLAGASVAAAAYGFLTLLGLATSLGIGTALRPFDLLVGYDNGRFFNHVQTSMLPLLAIASAHPFAKRLFNRLAWFGLVMGMALLTLTEGRATGLALFAAAAISMALHPRTLLPVLRNCAVAGMAAAAVYLILFVGMPRLAGWPVQMLHAGGVGDTGSVHTRFILWRIAFAGVLRSPWLGIGPMHFSHTWNAYAAHPHNVYLQVAEEWGVPMLCLLLVVALSRLCALGRAVRAFRGDEADRRMGAGLLLTLIAVGVDGFFSGNFVMPVSQVWIAVVVGLAMGWMHRATPRDPAQSGRLVACALRWAPLVAALWLVASVAPDLGVHFLDRPHPAGVGREAGAPRFWSNGWF